MIKATVSPPLSKVAKDLDERAKQMADTSPAMKKAAIHFDQWVQRNIKDEGSSLGSDRWPDFKYGGRINDEGRGSPIQIAVPFGVLDLFVDKSAKLLQKTGRLRQSMIPFANKDDAGIGSHLSYSKPHNEGLGVPQRRILPNASDVHNRVEEILHTHGLKALQGGL